MGSLSSYPLDDAASVRTNLDSKLEYVSTSAAQTFNKGFSQMRRFATLVSKDQ